MTIIHINTIHTVKAAVKVMTITHTIPSAGRGTPSFWRQALWGRTSWVCRGPGRFRRSGPCTPGRWLHDGSRGKSSLPRKRQQTCQWVVHALCTVWLCMDNPLTGHRPTDNTTWFCPLTNAQGLCHSARYTHSHCQRQNRKSQGTRQHLGESRTSTQKSL